MGAVRAFDEDVATYGLFLGNSCFHFVNVGESAEGGLIARYRMLDDSFLEF
jgi:hypothetical protein